MRYTGPISAGAAGAITQGPITGRAPYDIMYLEGEKHLLYKIDSLYFQQHVNVAQWFCHLELPLMFWVQTPASGCAFKFFFLLKTYVGLGFWV